MTMNEDEIKAEQRQKYRKRLPRTLAIGVKVRKTKHTKKKTLYGSKNELKSGEIKTEKS